MATRASSLKVIAERALANPLWQVRGATLPAVQMRYGGWFWTLAATINK